MRTRLNSVTLREHFEALRSADQRALQIKEEADRVALQLARDIQTYKDEKANELREQISQERGIYITRAELASAVREIQASIKPLHEYMNSDAGRNAGGREFRGQRHDQLVLVIAGLAVLVSVSAAILGAFHL
jgi:hypothetical protein